MSHGLEADYTATISQLRNPHPIQEDKTWLRHRINSQSGFMDLLILEGKHSKEDIARELKHKYNCKNPLARLERHLDHLNNADGADAWTGNIPHRCKIKEVNGKIKFTG